MLKLKRSQFISITSVVLFFLLWELVGWKGLVNPVFISRPSVIFTQGYKLFVSGELAPHLLASLGVLFSGLLLAAVVGIVGGLVIGSSETLKSFFKPYIATIQALPMVAIIPLIMIWFGLGFTSRAVAVFLMALTPILVSTLDGVKNADPDILKMARSFGANRWQLLKTVLPFSAMPFIFSGLKQSIGRGIIGIVIGEVLGAGKGLGYLVSFYGVTYKTAQLLFVVIILLAINFLLTELILTLEKRIVRW